MTSPTPASLLGDIRALISEARQRAAAAVNAELTLLYWRIGQRVREDVLSGERAGYGGAVIETLALHLQQDYGRGFSANCTMRCSSPRPTPMKRLSWSHFR